MTAVRLPSHSLRSIAVACIALLAAAGIALAEGEGPKVTVVTGEVIAKLERFASEELARMLGELFDAEVSVDESGEIPADAEHVILFGNIRTNPAIAELGGEHWPEDLSEQGHLLASVGHDGRTVLIVGGGSPVATLWAVYELGHHFGMRYTLHEDFLPIDAPQFSLADFSSVLEPDVAVRAWRTIDTGAAGQESWGLADHEKLIGQLAKLKFNRLTLVIHPWQPFYDVEGGDSPKTDGVLWHGREYPVDGDTAGRSVFDGAKIFENPDFAGATSGEERVLAGWELTRGITTAASESGMEFTFETNESEDADVETIALAHPGGGVLPQFYTSRLGERLAAIRDNEDVAGFALKSWIPGNLNADVYFLSRASFDAELTPAETFDSLVTPICGEGVAERLATGFAAIESVAALIDENDSDFAVPAPEMFMEHFESDKPAPEWWAKAKELYGVGVNEMYRGNTRARGGARPFILYHAKYFTFALHYMTAVEHTRAAGIARAAKDEAAWVENLELAVEAMHNALGIYAEVARDNSDRGVIAVLNKYAYRPLIEALDEAPLP